MVGSQHQHKGDKRLIRISIFFLMLWRKFPMPVCVYVDVERKYVHACDCTCQVTADESIYRKSTGFQSGVSQSTREAQVSATDGIFTLQGKQTGKGWRTGVLCLNP